MEVLLLPARHARPATLSTVLEMLDRNSINNVLLKHAVALTIENVSEFIEKGKLVPKMIESHLSISVC